MVLQEIFLFSGSIESNIRLGRADITEERVKWAGHEVSAEPFVNRLHGGYQAEVRERGAGLSVGQKQLISFARALAFDPSILILDEATSSIDTETEQLIQQAIERVMRNRTSSLWPIAFHVHAREQIVLHHGNSRTRTHRRLLIRAPY